MSDQFLVSQETTKEVITMRKIELLLDVLAALDNSNAPETYGVKISVVDKLERAINSL